MKRVLFTNAVNPFSEEENRYRPLWAGYLASYVEKHLGQGILEFRFMTDTLEKEIATFKPHIVGIGSVTKDFSNAIEYASIVKSYNLPVIIGGMHITFLPDCLTKDMDVGVIGEGEQTFLEIINLYLETNKFAPEGLKKINGIIYHDNGRIKRTPNRDVLKSLDELPHPKRSILGYGHRAYIVGARGCSYKCVFCSCSRFWGKTRYFSAEHIIEEIRELIENNVKVIRINDDNFPAKKRRLKQIADMIVANGFHKQVKFSCWSRANNITSETVEILKSMNMVSVVMGLESGCQRTLDYLKGNVTVEDNRRAINLLKDAGIQANADFVIGAPDESLEEIMQTYDFIKKSRVDQVTINILSPLPGTPIWDYAKKRNLIPDHMDWGRFNFDFKFNVKEGKESAVILSEKLNFKEFRHIYKKFCRLQFIHNVKALPRSPWLDEFPRIVLDRIKEIVMMTIYYKRKSNR